VNIGFDHQTDPRLPGKAKWAWEERSGLRFKRETTKTLPMGAKRTTNRQVGAVCEVPRRRGTKAVLGMDGAIYLRTRGTVEAMVPMNGRFAREWAGLGANGQPAEVIAPAGRLLRVDHTAVPPDGVLWWLHQRLFQRFSSEVGVLTMVAKGGRWTFVVPRQKATWGSWEFDDEDRELEATQLKLGDIPRTGTVHRHPGSDVRYSGTDETDLFAKVPGLHVILSNEGRRVGVYASVEGYVWTVQEPRDLDTTQGGRGRIVTQGGRKLSGLVREPEHHVIEVGTRPRMIGFEQEAESEEREVERWFQALRQRARKPRKRRKGRKPTTRTRVEQWRTRGMRLDTAVVSRDEWGRVWVLDTAALSRCEENEWRDVYLTRLLQDYARRLARLEVR